MSLPRHQRVGRLLAPLLLSALLSAWSLPSTAEAPAAKPQAFIAQLDGLQQTEPLAESLHTLLASKASSISALDPADAASLRSFYAGRNNKAIWVDASGLIPLGSILRTRLRQIAAIASPEIGALLQADAVREQHIDPASLAERELILSAAFMKVAIDPLAPEASASGLRALRDTASAGDPRAALERHLPIDPAFWRLRAAIAGYRALAADGGWPSLPEGPKLELGDRGTRVEALRERLSISGDLDRAAAATDLFDNVLDEAVRRFQRRHGLAVDGVVGKATLAALNLPIGTRTQTLSINLARLLDPPRDWGPRYIAVNLAAASYRLVDNGAPVFEQVAIVGRRNWPTPRFDGLMTMLEFNPYWVVPPRIARLELWPKIHQDPGYLTRNDMHLVDGQIRQDPGPKNPLGVVKFIFPNSYDVYLHDTNSPSLFGRVDRHLSHGCIRIPNARDLAVYLMQADPTWTADRVAEAIASGRNQRVDLPRPIAIHLVYDTAWVELDGTVEFRDDVYRQDVMANTASNQMVASTFSSCPTLR
jgi:murein L,D-transpeptidase YcbB/YkuD